MSGSSLCAQDFPDAVDGGSGWFLANPQLPAAINPAYEDCFSARASSLLLRQPVHFAIKRCGVQFVVGVETEGGDAGDASNLCNHRGLTLLGAQGPDLDGDKVG